MNYLELPKLGLVLCARPYSYPGKYSGHRFMFIDLSIFIDTRRRVATSSIYVYAYTNAKGIFRGIVGWWFCDRNEGSMIFFLCSYMSYHK